MYMSGMRGYRGMRGARRGLGQSDGTSTTTLNYPGMPDTSGGNQMIATPLSPQQIAALSAANSAFFNPPAQTQTFTAWLNSNALSAIIGTAIFLIGWRAFAK